MTARKKTKSLKGTKLLLVEDDDFLAEILRTKLSDDGGSLTLCTTGTEALNSIEQQIPDVIITDLMLPGMSGEELIGRIKENAKYSNIPLVVFSNKNDPAEIKKLLAIGVSEYHVKAQTSLKDIPKIIERALMGLE